MRLVSATDLAIALAIKSQTLRLVARVGRLGPFVAIEDDRGVIEVHSDMAEAQARVDAIAALI